MMAIQNFRKTDIVARYGGDEFVFVMRNSDLDNAAMVMSRLEAQFINWAGIHNITVGLSYGIKELSDTIEKLEEIMHAADEALYESKGNKRMLRT
jgi:diguanylate cyclase (GGDEF)-like protein